MSKTKALIFDMGGVLVDLDFEAALSAFRELGFNDIDQYLDPCIQRGFFMDMESGSLSEEGFYDEVLKHCRKGTEPEDIVNCFRRFVTEVRDEKARYLRELKDRGYRIYMLSNNNPVAMHVCPESFLRAGIDMNEIFDALFISYRMKMMKPGREIFDAAALATGFDKSELLFIDDSMTNVRASEEAGIPAIHYVQGTDLREAVEKRL